MIQVPAGFQPRRVASGSKLPAGLYVCAIEGAKVENTGYNNAPQLKVMVEIIEGDYINYFHQDYQTRASGQYADQAKYKGVIKLNLPSAQDDDKRKLWNTRSLEGFTYAVNESNPGYTWNYDENALKGKKIGINVRNASYNGNAYTEIAYAESVEDIRAGRAKVAPDRKPRGDANDSGLTYDSQSGMQAVNEPELPF